MVYTVLVSTGKIWVMSTCHPIIQESHPNQFLCKYIGFFKLFLSHGLMLPRWVSNFCWSWIWPYTPDCPRSASQVLRLYTQSKKPDMTMFLNNSQSFGWEIEIFSDILPFTYLNSPDCSQSWDGIKKEKKSMDFTVSHWWLTKVLFVWKLALLVPRPRKDM